LRQAETTRTVNLLKEVDVAVIGAGPAGLAAALACAEAGVSTLLIDGNDAPGGQLVKQTHKFFGSERQHAGTRGIQIPDIFTGKLADYPNVEIMWNTNASGFYDSGELVIEDEKRFMKILPKRVIVATGASERFLMFRNNDLPGVYGAGAVQTLMNVYGVVPGDRVLMVGSGNIGLIVSYQLIQAGVEVAAVIEAAPCIGGYLVHAAKLRRAGVPILTSHTILATSGEGSVDMRRIVQLLESLAQHVAGRRSIRIGGFIYEPVGAGYGSMEAFSIGEYGELCGKTSILVRLEPGGFNLVCLKREKVGALCPLASICPQIGQFLFALPPFFIQRT
jgi:NADPH-dependent 2,4-dienoyl-CoA reductase/sulfur reductase-like enzyme